MREKNGRMEHTLTFLPESELPELVEQRVKDEPTLQSVSQYIRKLIREDLQKAQVLEE